MLLVACDTPVVACELLKQKTVWFLSCLTDMAAGSTRAVAGAVTEVPKNLTTRPTHWLWTTASPKPPSVLYQPGKNTSTFETGGKDRWPALTAKVKEQVESLLGGKAGKGSAGSKSSTGAAGSGAGKDGTGASSSRPTSSSGGATPAKTTSAAQAQGSGQTGETAKKGSAFNLSFDKKPRSNGSEAGAAGSSGQEGERLVSHADLSINSSQHAM